MYLANTSGDDEASQHAGDAVAKAMMKVVEVVVAGQDDHHASAQICPVVIENSFSNFKPCYLTLSFIYLH